MEQALLQQEFANFTPVTESYMQSPDVSLYCHDDESSDAAEAQQNLQVKNKQFTKVRNKIMRKKFREKQREIGSSMESSSEEVDEEVKEANDKLWEDSQRFYALPCYIKPGKHQYFIKYKDTEGIPEMRKALRR